MIDVDGIRARWEQMVPHLDERGRRLFAANEALIIGFGGVTAVSAPGLLAALEAVIEDAIRGDPQSPLRWTSRSQRNIAQALEHRGFKVSQKLVGLLLRQLKYSCQANRKTREGASHPDRNGQFEYINAAVKACPWQRTGDGACIRRTGDLRRHQKERAGRGLQEQRSRTASPQRS